MRKSMFLYVFISVLLLSGCGHARYYNSKADDAISKAIYEGLGDVVYYIGKGEYSDGQEYYRYLIREENSELLLLMVDVVNEIILQEDISDDVIIYLCYEIPGGTGSAVRMCFFTSEELEVIRGGLQKLVIIGNEDEDNEYIYNNPSTYLGLTDIESLKIREEIQERAEAEGIDWYEYWPDLESIETF